MFKKIHVFYVLLGCFGLNTSAFALDCDIVARIHPLDRIDEVYILRAGKQLEKASSENRRLCPGDVVKVPKSISEIKIKYHSNKRKILKSDQSYEVVALQKPCQALCKFKAKLSNLYEQFTMTEPAEISIPTGSKGTSKSSPIKMPLAASEGSDYEFFLSADNGAIPLFWYGGKVPYKLTVKDALGKVIVNEQLEKPKFSLILPDTKIGSKYSLTIQSVDSLSCNEDNSQICQKPLVVMASETETMEQLVALLANCEDRNWRLEIWRQLNVMPDSKAKRNFMEHLAENDIDLYDFELCE